jgi:hypothetical protein
VVSPPATFDGYFAKKGLMEGKSAGIGLRQYSLPVSRFQSANGCRLCYHYCMTELQPNHPPEQGQEKSAELVWLEENPI